MRRPIIIIISVVLVFLLIGTIFTSMTQFSSSSNAVQRDLIYGLGGGGGGAPAVAMPPVEAPAGAPESASEFGKSGEAFDSAVAGQAAQERLVIENADLSIVVKDPKARMAEIGRLATDLGGYVVSSNLYQSYTALGVEVPEASIVVRVPSEKLDEVLAQIKEGAVDVPTEVRSGQDVTNIYVDLQAQLRAKEAAEQKLLEIMDEAARVEDVLAVYLQVQSIQTEIEQLKGQIKYYEESAALSSVSVRLIAEEGTQPIEVGPWKPEGAAKAAVEDLIRFLQNFAEFLIRFVIFTLPALILIAIPLLLVFFAGRAIYRRFRKPVVSTTVIEQEEKK